MTKEQLESREPYFWRMGGGWVWIRWHRGRLEHANSLPDEVFDRLGLPFTAGGLMSDCPKVAPTREAALDALRDACR